MQAFVPSETRPVCERASADGTREWFLSRVNPSVGQQMRLGDERLLAELAVVRSLPGVNSFMRHERRTGGEILAANLAHVRSLARVYSHVLLQAARVYEII